MTRHLKRSALSILSMVALVSTITIARAQGPAEGAGEATQGYSWQGAAFAMTNVVDDNRIVTYRRAADGELTRVGSISTRGNGIGTDLDTQGGLRLSSDHRFLYAVNAGSDEITVFSVNGPNLTFLQKIYAGDEPNSMAIHEHLLYVLDGSVAGNGILGFRIRSNGTLAPLPGSFRLLSSPIAVPGDIEFSPDGHVLLVTEKTTNKLLDPEDAIDSFRIGSDGLASAIPKRLNSHGLRPFSLAFRDDGKLVVAESFNAALGRSAVSSYRLTSEGALDLIDGSVRNYQTDTCWVVVTDDGRYVYTANFGSGTISSYRLDSDGDLHLIDGKAAFLGALSQPVDLALSSDSGFLYLLLRGKGAVAGFKVRDDGGLAPLGVVKGGLPVNDGASGLAAF
ncbi:MAG: beta-propeller fold lactonase family protein [Actinobacteria bacterium]|nr:beta-propeller fold lactonase family protein [Actinomycetota bacterium]